MQEMATAVSCRELSANPGRQDHLQLCLSLDNPPTPHPPTNSSPPHLQTSETEKRTCKRR